MYDSATYRILDAAINRSQEGLRVIEDFVRFALDDAHLLELLKAFRHEFTDVCLALPPAARQAARETQQDVGTRISTAGENSRRNALEVCQASCERVKQALRSLEEYSKVGFPGLANQLEALRYRFYTLERGFVLTHLSCARLENVHLCVLIDGQGSAQQFAALAAELVRAQVPMLQLRDKNINDATLLERCQLLVQLARDATDQQRPLILVNDRADIAVAAQADGVHLGQTDLPVKAAREIIGPEKLVGVSTHSLEQARTAVLDGANYLGAGPTFPSPTKHFAEFPGVEFLQQLAGEIRLPTFAIGGIGLDNLAQVQATGIARVAVGSAITAAANPAATAREIAARLQSDT